MPRPYSVDLRVRVIGDISTGASRREAAERYGVSPSVVVISTTGLIFAPDDVQT
jgi:transposase